MTRRVDLAWEALVAETRANPHYERGAINKALQGIRAAAFHEGLLEDDLHVEIRLRAEMYRQRWPNIELTPGALAKHWYRVAAPRELRTEQQITLERLKMEAGDV
jgi:hypothetical protein